MATGIFKRGGVWWIRYTGLDGKQKRESTGSESFEDAKLRYAERVQAIGQGKEPEIKRIPNYSFAELATRYVGWVEGRQKSARIKGYIIGQLLSKYKDVPLNRFTTALVDQLQTDLISNEYQVSSINKILNILKHMFNKAVEWEMVDAEVLKRIRKVKPLKGENKRLRYLSEEECAKLINACEPHLKPIVITALNTGMRRGEIFGLTWDRVDLKHGFILLDRTKNGERREIPINPTLREMFSRLPRPISDAAGVPQYVFYNTDTRLAFQDLKRAFAKACRKAGIVDFRFHDLRHTFASHLVMSGVDITTVSRLLGHKSLTMTLRYSHLAPSHMVNAVNILDRALNGKWAHDARQPELAQN